MNLYPPYVNYPELPTPSAFDSPISPNLADCIDSSSLLLYPSSSTSSSSSPYDLAQMNHLHPSLPYDLNPPSVERLITLESLPVLPYYSTPITPPDRHHQIQLVPGFSTTAPISATSSTFTSNSSSSSSSSPSSAASSTVTRSGSSITTSVIVPNPVSPLSHLSSSTAATMTASEQGASRARRSSGTHLLSNATSSTVSTITMVGSTSSGASNTSSTSSNQNGASSSSSSSGQQQLCKVCGDVALGKNFGVQTCGSCKIFFRRNYPTDRTKLQCRNNNRCTIIKPNRRNCAACRLRKCLDLGMRVKQAKSRGRNGEATSGREENRQVTEAGQPVSGPGSRTGSRHNSRSSASEEDDDRFIEDLPTLVPYEEVAQQLADRLNGQPVQESQQQQQQLRNEEEVELDDLNSIIERHISDQTGELPVEQLEPGIEPLDAGSLPLGAPSPTGQLISACVQLLNETEQLTGLGEPESDSTAAVPVITSLVPQTVNHGDAPIISEEESRLGSQTQVDSSALESDVEEGVEILSEEDSGFINSPQLAAKEKPYYEPQEQRKQNTQTHVVYVDQPDGTRTALDLDSPEAIEQARQMRLLYFYQTQSQTPLLGYRNSPEAEYGEEYRIHDGRALARHKRAHCESDGSERDSCTLALARAEAQTLNSPVAGQIAELCRLTSQIRIKFGFEYDAPNQCPSYRKEMFNIQEMNSACRLINDTKPNLASHQCTNVYDTLRHGIFYANKTFKSFENFWQHNNEMVELIRQDVTGFDRKKNNLLHQMYHLRGVYNYDDGQNAWTVRNGTKDDTFTLIKLSMFKESVKKEMTMKHHNFIQSFPKEWRTSKDPSLFNIMTFLLTFSAFEPMQSPFQSEKIRYFKVLYLAQRYFEKLYSGDKAKSMQMMAHMLQLMRQLSPLCADCLTACTHSVNPQELKEIGPNYAECLMLEEAQKKRDAEQRRRRKHSRTSECGEETTTTTTGCVVKVTEMANSEKVRQ